MRCTDCKYSKELIPAELHYVYCTIAKENKAVWAEFDKCSLLNREKEHEEK